MRYIDSTKMGRARRGWLDSHFHFSFAEYYKPDNIQFGVLCVVNDDIVQPGRGFPPHPHQDMEILSYVLEGKLTHGDSMGNKRTISRGEVQYMSAGTGVFHSEYNLEKGPLRFLQIWIEPDWMGHQPQYGDHRFRLEDREGKWLAVATGVANKTSEAPIKLHQDINMYATIVRGGGSVGFKVGDGRQAYMVLAEGRAEVVGSKGGRVSLRARDAVEIVEEDVTVKAEAGEDAHAVLIEMKKCWGIRWRGRGKKPPAAQGKKEGGKMGC